jgi:hypothetical protein
MYGNIRSVYDRAAQEACFKHFGNGGSGMQIDLTMCSVCHVVVCQTDCHDWFRRESKLVIFRI